VYALISRPLPGLSSHVPFPSASNLYTTLPAHPQTPSGTQLYSASRVSNVAFGLCDALGSGRFRKASRAYASIGWRARGRRVPQHAASHSQSVGIDMTHLSHTYRSAKVRYYSYIHTYIHACMHAHMHACMHTYTHTHTHTDRQTDSVPRLEPLAPPDAALRGEGGLRCDDRSLAGAKAVAWVGRWR